MLLNTMDPHHSGNGASDWVVRFSPLIRPGGSVLDVACGTGRHLRWLAQQGHAVTGVDIDADKLASTKDLGEMVQADIENQPWPLMQGRTHGQVPRQFDAVVVTNYLWRPLFAQLLASLAPGGVLIYETFALGNARYGRPASPDFLLQPGELLWRCAALSVVAYEHGLLHEPTRVVQRIAAVRPENAGTALGRMAHYPI